MGSSQTPSPLKKGEFVLWSSQGSAGSSLISPSSFLNMVVLLLLWETSPDCYSLPRTMVVASQRHWPFPLAPHLCILPAPMAPSTAIASVLPDWPSCPASLIQHCPWAKAPERKGYRQKQGGAFLLPGLPCDPAAGLPTQSTFTCPKWPGMSI